MYFERTEFWDDDWNVWLLFTYGVGWRSVYVNVWLEYFKTFRSGQWIRWNFKCNTHNANFRARSTRILHQPMNDTTKVIPVARASYSNLFLLIYEVYLLHYINMKNIVFKILIELIFLILSARDDEVFTFNLCWFYNSSGFLASSSFSQYIRKQLMMHIIFTPAMQHNGRKAFKIIYIL